MKRLLFLWLIPFGLLGMVGNTNAATYYVDAVNGNDSWAGTTSATAWKSLAKVQSSSFSSGDFILFKRGGSWGGLTISASGTSGSPITFGAYGSGAKPLFTNGSGNGIQLNNVSYVTLDGLSSGNNSAMGIYYSDNGTGVVIKNCSSFGNMVDWQCGIYVYAGGSITNCTITYDTVYGNAYHGIIFSHKVSGSTISHCYVHDNSIGAPRGHGISSFSADASNHVDGCIYEYNEVFNQCYGKTNNGIEGTGIQMDDYTSNAIVRYNRIHDNQGWGLYQNGGTGNQWSYNVVYKNDLGGFVASSTVTAPTSTLYNNTFFGNGGQGMIFPPVHGALTVKNNLVVQNTKYEMYDNRSGASGSDVFDNNLYYHSAGGNFLYLNQSGSDVGYTTLAAYKAAWANDAHAMNVYPAFTDSAGRNFTLQGGSPAINAGTNVGLTKDINGFAISGNPDIGAYEYTGNAPAPPLPTGSFTASPDTVTAGGVVTLTWTDSNATSASINNGVGPVSIAGGKMPVSVDTSTTFTFTVTNSTGSRSYKASVTALPPKSSFPSGSLTASPDTLAAGGVVTLTWTGSNATSASINNGVGSVSITGGKKSAAVDTSVTFVLTLTNSTGSRTYKAAVTVLPPKSSLPSGSFTASPDTLTAGGVVTLTWTDSNATSASIDNGVGVVQINGGRMSVTADTSRRFTLTLTNSAGSRTYRAAITVVSAPGGTASHPVPTECSLSQNYPNPFNPTTTIRYGIPRASHVSLTVYDMLGREVSVLANDTKEAGVYQVRFDASSLASGMYFYLLKAGSFVDSKKLLLVH